jgi:transcriptional regulator with XRE-family HTH domain
MMAREQKKERPGLITQLKEAIRNSGQSLNQLGQASGVSSAQLSRFMTGKRSLTLPAAEKLCAILGLGLAPLPADEPPRRRPGGEAPGTN